MSSSPTSTGGRGAVLLSVVCFSLLVAPSFLQAGEETVTPRSLPGFESTPWGALRGSVGDWVRYRVGNEHLQETSYMTLALVEMEDEHAAWVEVRVARSSGSSTGDLAVRTLARAQGDDLVTERMIVRMGGGTPVELDMDTLPDAAPARGAPPYAEASACASPDSPACLRAASRGMDIRPGPTETILTAAGSLRAVPVRVRMRDGDVMSFVVSESIPITALVRARTPDGTHLELDGLGDGAAATLPKTAKTVSYSELGDALSRGLAAGGALQSMGRLVNPDDARQDERELPPDPSARSGSSPEEDLEAEDLDMKDEEQ